MFSVRDEVFDHNNKIIVKILNINHKYKNCYGVKVIDMPNKWYSLGCTYYCSDYELVKIVNKELLEVLYG